MRFEGTERYERNPEVRDIVTLAITGQKPLVLLGEAGTGMPRLASAGAGMLGLALLPTHTKSFV